MKFVTRKGFFVNWLEGFQLKVALLGSTHEVKKPWTGGSSELEQTQTKEEEKTGSESEPILETMLVRLEVKTTGVKSLGVLSSAE